MHSRSGTDAGTRGMTKKRRFYCELVSWAAVMRLAHDLALRILQAGFRPDVVVAIARGGYVPARLLCDFLDLTDLSSIRIVHYAAGADKRRNAGLVEGLCRSLDGRNVLLVDDVSDTGDTLVLGREHMEELGADDVRIAVLHHKQTSTVQPEFFAHRIVEWRWIIYPWAVAEDVTGFIDRLPRPPADTEETVRLLREHFGLHIRPSLVEKIVSLSQKYRALSSS